MGPDTKIFFDIALNRYQATDLEDKLIKDLAGPERQCYRDALLSALQNRGLLACR